MTMTITFLQGVFITSPKKSTYTKYNDGDAMDRLEEQLKKFFRFNFNREDGFQILMVDMELWQTI